MEDPNKSMEVKRNIIEDKLADLQGNTQFIQELTERLAAFDQHKSRLKNVVSDADIDVQGDVHIGDKGSASGDHYDEKDVIKGGNIKAGGGIFAWGVMWFRAIKWKRKRKRVLGHL